MTFGLFINPFQPSIVFNKETSHLFRSTKQMTGFYMKHSSGLKWINNFSKINKQFLLNLLVFNLQIGTDATTIDTRKMTFSYNRFLHSNLQRVYNLPIILQRLVSITWALCFDVASGHCDVVVWWFSLLHILQSLNSDSGQVQILLAAFQRFEMVRIFGTKYSRMNQLKFVKDSL